MFPTPPSPRTERDVTGWSTDKLTELLVGCRVERDGASCRLTDVTKLEGEASINNRKGKLIFFYEWVIKASWMGESPGDLGRLVR